MCDIAHVHSWHENKVMGVKFCESENFEPLESLFKATCQKRNRFNLHFSCCLHYLFECINLKLTGMDPVWISYMVWIRYAGGHFTGRVN